MEFSRWRNILVVLICVMVFIAGIFFVLAQTFEANSQITYPVLPATVLPASNTTAKLPEILPPPQKLSNPPKIIKAVYLTGNSAGRKAYLNYLTNIFKTSGVNAVVVDIKGSSGYVTYPGAIADIDSLVRFFHNQNIYVIGRIAVFEDPVYSKARPDLAIYNKEKTIDLKNPVLWKDNNGLSWLDPASQDVWDYNISIAKDAFSHGFDEMNFDYIRFPSDGKMSNMGFPIYNLKTPKREIIKNFYKYLREQLINEKLSADLFGQTTVNKDDMGIGQVMEDALKYFDYLSPMVYPSHFINGFIGFRNPAEYPYEVVKYSMDSGITRLLQATSPEDNAVFRPWLQDFNMGAFYTSSMVKSEIKATEDSLGGNYRGFMLWNPSNIYIAGAVPK